MENEQTLKNPTRKIIETVKFLYAHIIYEKIWFMINKINIKRNIWHDLHISDNFS